MHGMNSADTNTRVNAFTLAIDAMGGDAGLPVTLPACAHFLATHPAARVILVGDEPSIRAAATAHRLDLNSANSRASVQHASEVVTMDDPLEVALRRKKDSSMRVAINCVKDGRAQAAVSAGNTGALMAVARFVLKTMDGIDRPAIASFMPNHTGRGTVVLDLGANVDCTAEHLQQFALLGSALADATMSKLDAAGPRVGLLNIGHEDIKGNEVVKAAAELLAHTPIHYIGNVEGNQIFSGDVDVVVCDGFVGNVLLKTAEGLSNMVRHKLVGEFKKNIFRKIGAFFALPAINAFRKDVDGRRYNGAALLGLRGVVVKSHGGADAFAFEHALARAHDMVERHMLATVTAGLSSLHANDAPKQ
ncbi:MAG: phosphate acyltransferase PlsX [Formosimonas sp.]